MLLFPDNLMLLTRRRENGKSNALGYTLIPHPPPEAHFSYYGTMLSGYLHLEYLIVCADA